MDKDAYSLELRLPRYYVLSRLVDVELAGDVQRLLGITPVGCSVISDPQDSELAAALGYEMLLVNSDEAAKALAIDITEEFHQPVLVIGEAAFLDAVYSDGTREAVVNTC